MYDVFDDRDVLDFAGRGDNIYSPASGSDAICEVTLDTIHNDLQLLHFSVLSIFIVAFVLFCIRKWR